MSLSTATASATPTQPPTQSQPPPTTGPTATSGSSAGATAGGTIGGLIFIILIILIDSLYIWFGTPRTHPVSVTMHCYIVAHVQYTNMYFCTYTYGSEHLCALEPKICVLSN